MALGDAPTGKQVRNLHPAAQKAYHPAQNVAVGGIFGGGVTSAVGNHIKMKGQISNTDAFAEAVGEKSGSKNIGNVERNARLIRNGKAMEKVGSRASKVGWGAAGVATVIGSRAKHKKMPPKTVAKSAFGVDIAKSMGKQTRVVHDALKTPTSAWNNPPSKRAIRRGIDQRWEKRLDTGAHKLEKSAFGVDHKISKADRRMGGQAEWSGHMPKHTPGAVSANLAGKTAPGLPPKAAAIRAGLKPIKIATKLK